MALKPLNSVAGFSVGETPANIILANGDITTTNFTASGISNLNAIGNIIITGGTNGQVIQTDGSGNLSFVTISTASLSNGNSNIQVLANGNITFSSAGNANVAVVTGSGINVAGYLSAANITASGNVSVNNYLVTPSSVDLIVAPATQLTRFYSNVNPFSGGYSLGNSLARWDNVFSNTANVSGNVSAGNVLTDHLLYANGQPWDLQEAAGSNTQIQYNDGNNNFGASSAFTFDYAGNLLTVTGNANITGAVNTANINSGTSTFVINANGYTTTFNANGLVEFDDGIFTTGNLTVGNANLGNLVTANFINVSSNLEVTDTANVGNLRTDNLLYANGQPWDLQEAAGANTQIQYNDGNNNFGASANFTFDYGTSLLTVTGTANVTGNLTAGNVDGGNLVKANNFSTNGSGGDITLTGGNVVGANVVIANSFTSNGGTVDFATNNANVQLGSNANVHISGGSSGQVLQTDGAGNLNWYSVSASGIQNGNSNVSIPDVDGNVYIHANAGSDQQWNFDTSGVLITPGNINLNGSSLVDNTGSGIELYSNNYAQLNYNDDVYVYTQSNGVWLETNGGGNVHLGTDGNVSMSGNLSVTGNIANANNISVTQTLKTYEEQLTSLSSTYVVYGNGSGYLVGDSAFTFNDTTKTLSIGNANIATDLVVQGNIANANNISVTNNITAGSGNITNDLDVGGNIVTGNGSGGNISGVNVLTANVVNANSFNTGLIANGTSNIRIDQDGNITLSSNNLSNVFTLSYQGANIVGYVSANGNGTFGAVKSNSVTAQGGNLELYSEQSGNSYIQLRTFGDGTVDVGNVRITSLATPNASTDAATKQYVDDVAQGLNVHDAALAATANTLANLTGGIITYNNGTAGVGANLVLSGSPTLNYLSANVFDGNVTAVAGSRILVKSETNQAYNGIYVVSNSTVLTRAADYNTVPEVEAGDFIFVEDGTTYNDSGWVQTSVVTTMGTDPIVFTQFSGAGTYQAGAGLTLTGTVFSVNVDNVTTEISGGNVIVKANAQLTTPNIDAATGTSLDLTGNLIAGNLNSNATITGVDLNLTGNVLAANISANANLVVNNATVNLELSGNTANFTGNIKTLNANLGNLVIANYHQVTSLANTQIPYANATNVLVGTTNFVYDAPNQVLKVGAGGTEIGGDAGYGYIQTKTGNFSGNINSLNANLGNLVTANYANFTNDLVVQGNIANANNITVTNNVTANDANIIGNTITNNLTVNLDISGNTANFTGNVYSPSLVANTTVVIGNSSVITYGNVTTTSITANQTIASFNITGVTGVEYLVKAVDQNGVANKYSVATVLAVTDGTSVDYTIYGSSQLGGYTGSLAVNVSGSFIRLQVTPSSSNSTVWTTQYRLI